MGKLLIGTGILLIIAGVVLVFWQRIPIIGKLPGDIIIHRGNSAFFFPIVTMLIVSVLLSIIFNVVIRILNK